MVLKYLITVFCILSVSTDHLTDGPLLKNYKSKIKKELKSISSDTDGSVNLINLNLEFHNLEAYSLVDQEENINGYLFIKEVKACSLNGCLAKSKEVDTVGSEYYDISVLTDKNKTIKSIKVLDYFSDYGYQITSKRYLKKYAGKNLCDFQPDNPLIDGISGATISYNALISSLTEFCNILSNN